MLLRRDLVLELRLRAVQVAQLGLVSIHDLLLVIELLLEGGHLGLQDLVPVDHLVDLGEDAGRLRALLLVPLRQLLQLLVLHDQIRLQVVFLLLEPCALLAEVGALLLELGKLGPQLTQPEIFVATLSIGLGQVVVQELLLVRLCALVDFIAHTLQLAHLLHLAQLALLDPLPKLIVQDGFFLEVGLIEAVSQQAGQVQIVALTGVDLLVLLLRLLLLLIGVLGKKLHRCMQLRGESLR